MGLQISYTDKEGETHAESYWVISNVVIEKKLNDNTLAPIADEDLSDHVRFAGYYCIIILMGWRSKEHRDNGRGARFVHSVHPTGWQPPENYHEITTNEEYRFTWDITSTDSLLTQAYQHLLTLDLFTSATEI